MGTAYIGNTKIGLSTGRLVIVHTLHTIIIFSFSKCRTDHVQICQIYISTSSHCPHAFLHASMGKAFAAVSSHIIESAASGHLVFVLSIKYACEGGGQMFVNVNGKVFRPFSV